MRCCHAEQTAAMLFRDAKSTQQEASLHRVQLRSGDLLSWLQPFSQSSDPGRGNLPSYDMT